MKHERPDLPPYAKIRQTNRGSYERERAYSILDAGIVGHVGFIADGRPMVMPMAYARVGDRLFVHGASTTRIIQNNSLGVPASMTVTLLDGLVVARAAFHLSVNYRSAIIHGTAREVTDMDEKSAALSAITDHLLPGRWDESRPMLPKELKATGVLAIDIEHAASKVRNAPPVDEAADHDLDIWAGVVPIATGFGQPFADPYVKAGTPVPASVEKARRKFI